MGVDYENKSENNFTCLSINSLFYLFIHPSFNPSIHPSIHTGMVPWFHKVLELSVTLGYVIDGDIQVEMLM